METTMNKRIGALCLFLLGAFAHAEQPADPFNIDLTPNSSAVETVQRPPTGPSGGGQSPISSSIQNLNPDISFVGDFLAGNHEALTTKGSPLQRPASLREMEIDGNAYVSPYAKGTFVASFGDDTAGTEEAYMTFFDLPGSLNVKVGKFLIDVDTLNPTHQHAIPFVDRPLIEQHLFGDEGFKTVGLNASILIPNPWDHYLIFSGTYGGNLNNQDQYTALYGGNLDSAVYTGRFGTSWDLTDASYLTLNASGTEAPLPDGSTTIVYAADALIRIAKDPASNAATLLHGFLWNRGNPNQLGTATNTGFYDYLGWQFSHRWRAGVRYEESGDVTFDGFEKQYSGILSFYPTETNYIRIQYGRHLLPETATRAAAWENRVWLQIDFTIGPHQQHIAL